MAGWLERAGLGLSRALRGLGGNEAVEIRADRSVSELFAAGSSDAGAGAPAAAARRVSQVPGAGERPPSAAPKGPAGVSVSNVGVSRELPPSVSVRGLDSPAPGPSPADGLEIDGVGFHRLAWVRATGHEGLQHGDGGSVLSARGFRDGIRELSQAINGEKKLPVFRNSIHGSLNHHVDGHVLGEWRDKPFVVVAPFDRMVAANGPPAVLEPVDTYWVRGPGAPLAAPGSVLVHPAREGSLSAGALSAREGNRIGYRVDFDDASEKAVMAGRSRGFDRGLLDDLVEHHRRGERAAYEDGSLSARMSAQMALPRAERSGPVNEVVDLHLRAESKRQAVNQAIGGFGPVKDQGLWHRDVVLSRHQPQVDGMARALGSSTGQHFGSAEDRAMDAMSLGRAADVTRDSTVSKETRDYASFWSGHAMYEMFRKSRGLDQMSPSFPSVGVVHQPRAPSYQKPGLGLD